MCLQLNSPEVFVRLVIGKVCRNSYRYLIMGPTGAGKSTFIEALGGSSHGLKISGNQLASVTQRVTAYELVNVTRAERPVYIIDTPGFSDSKISEQEIVGMVNTWTEDNNVDIDQILFLTPITATRLEGTKRRTLNMIKELLNRHNLDSMTFVTTMWDQLSRENTQRRAESNFKQLEKDILKPWIVKGATITRFKNNQPSALAALNKSSWYTEVTFRSRPALLYFDLNERISTALQEKQMIEGDLANSDSTNNALIAILKKNHADNEDLLVKFIGQLRQYEEIPNVYEDQHAHISAVIVALGAELERMEVRARERELALGHQPTHGELVLRKYQQRLQSELEVFPQRQQERKRLEQQREMERQEQQRDYEAELKPLEHQRLQVRERKLTYRHVRQKIQHATTSITDFFTRTS